MDEFESRLTDDLSMASSGVKAGPGLEGALKRKVRRRHAVASIAAAVPMLLLIIGAVWLVNSSDEDGAFEFDTVVEPEPEPAEGPPSDPSTLDPLRDALVALGADVESAPMGAVVVGDATWCGVVDRDAQLPGLDEANRCLRDSVDADESAVMVSGETIPFDAPAIVVLRSEQGDLVRYVYAILSTDGEYGWAEQRCTVMVVDREGAFELEGCVQVDPPPPDDPLRTALAALGVDLAAAPAPAIALDGADWCGVDFFSDDLGDAGNSEARRCLLDAWDTFTPAVIVYEITTIDGDSIVEVHRVSTEGYIVRWVDPTRNDSGSNEWSTWYCIGMDRSTVGFDPIVALARDCANAPPDDSITKITLAPGETRTVVWPNQNIFYDISDVNDLFIITPAELGGLSSWAQVGTATRNDDGTSTLSLSGPSGLATLAHTEFGEATSGPISDRFFDLVPAYSTSAITRIEVIGSANRAADDPPESTLQADVDSSILGSDGLADARWGDNAADVLPDFAARFGPPISDRVLVECLTLRKVEYANGLRVWFSSETDFALEKPDQAGLAGYRYLGGGDDPPLTTRGGLAIGAPLDDIVFLGGKFNGGYDSAWGAYGWFLDDAQGGTLTHDMTDPRARVGSISAGALGNPDRMVC